MQDDHSTTDRQAVNRLFDLAHSGDVDNCEYGQLDSLVYEKLLRNYQEPDITRPLGLVAGNRAGR